MIDLETAKTLTHGTIIYDRFYTNADGSPARWRINGKVKTWKRSPHRVEIPIKRGLYEYGYLTETNLDQFTLTEDAARE